MSQYCQYSDLLNLFDAVNLAASTNDYNSNAPVNMTVLNSVCTQASNACDAYVASIYTVPFVSPPPATILQASIIFAAEILQQRRLVPGEKNMYTPQANTWRERLQNIGNGMLPLDERFARGFTPIVAKTYPSRLNASIY